MRESKVADYLKRVVKDAGGEIRKVRWEGRNHAPDFVVMLPQGVTFWVETKASNGVLRPAQHREHERMRAVGQTVYVPYSIADIDELMSNHR